MRKQGRFDFEVEATGSTAHPDTQGFRLRPSPRRYIQIVHEGKRYYKDKFLHTLISLEDMAREMKGLPIYSLTPSIQSTANYSDSRLTAVERQLEGGEYVPPNEQAKSHQAFAAGCTKDIAFLSVDICAGTAYRRRDPLGFDNAYEVFLRELGTLVGHFRGSILKTTGDGFIAYIDHPSFTSQCDNTIDLGLSLLSFLTRTLNPALKSAGLKPFSIRVGADFGQATSRTFEIPSTGYRNVDVVSDALNRAVKIQETCRPNQFRIGRDLYELAHVQWLERCAHVSFDGTNVGIDGYKVYIVR